MNRLVTIALSFVIGLGFGDSSVAAQDKAAPKMIHGGILNGKATSLPKPSYPAEARAARVSGTVKVQVLISETGDVVSATAIDGPPVLQAVSVEAARLAKFSPTTLSGAPVKVAGVITYNFVLDSPPAMGSEKGLLGQIPIAERESIWAVGMFFSFIQVADAEVIRMMGDEQEFNDLLKNLPQEVSEDVAVYKPVLEKIKSADYGVRAEAAREFLKLVRQEFNQEQNWQVDAGEQVGFLMAEMLRQKLQYVKTGVAFDTNILRSHLRRLSDLINSAPAGVSPASKKKFSKVAVFAEDANLGTDARLEALMIALSPLFAEFENYPDK